MPKRTSTPLKTNSYLVKSKKHCSIPFETKKQSNCIQSNLIETHSNSINAFNDINDIIMKGKDMNDIEFENFVKVHAPNSYWKVLAERSRVKLDHQLRENRQLHELYDELIKENEHLKIKYEQCEYLTGIFNSMMSEHDSGIELNLTNESPETKRLKIFT